MLRFPCESPRWYFLVLAGVEKEAEWGTVFAARLTPWMSGRAGSSTREPILTRFPAACSSPALPFRGRRRRGEEALEVHSHVSGTPAPAEPLWYLETVPGFSRRVLWGVFFKMFVFKILIKERQGVQLLANCCAGLLKDQHMWTHGLFNFWCCEFFIFLLRFMVCFISGFADLQRAVKSPNLCT